MKVLLLTNDLVLLSYVQALLSDAELESVVFDQHISMAEGSIGAFPRRVLVTVASWQRAARVLEEAGLGSHIAYDRERN